METELKVPIYLSITMIIPIVCGRRENVMVNCAACQHVAWQWSSRDCDISCNVVSDCKYAFGVLCNSLRLIRPFSAISKTEENNNPQMVIRLSIVRLAH